MGTEIAIPVEVGVAEDAAVRGIVFMAATIDGEKFEDYEAFYKRVRLDLEPKDVIEEFACYDIMNLQWESMRLRRVKTYLTKSYAPVGVRSALSRFMDYAARDRLTKKWMKGEEEAVEKVNSLLAQIGPIDFVISAHTLVQVSEKLEKIDQAITQIEARREATLRELERRRAALAQQVRKVIEHVETVEDEEKASGDTEGTEADIPESAEEEETSTNDNVGYEDLAATEGESIDQEAAE
jgi:DNA-binding TFAR19-related protein (PDSD5 family)